MKKIAILAIAVIIIVFCASSCAEEIPSILAENWDKVTPLYGQADYYIVQKDGAWGVVDGENNIILDKGAYPEEAGAISIPAEPTPNKESSSLRYSVYTYSKNGKYGLMKEETLTDAIYSEIIVSNMAPSCAKLGDKWGYIDLLGNHLTEFIFQEAHPFQDGYAQVMIDDKWGYINLNGEYAIEPQYYDADRFRSLYARVSPKQGLWGVINAENDYILPPEYENIYFIEDFLTVCARKNGEDAYFNLYHDKAVPVGQFHEKYPFTEPYSAHMLPDKSFLVDGNRRMVLSPKYRHITYDEDGLVSAFLDGKQFHFDLSTGVPVEIKIVDSSFSLDEYKPNAGSKVAVLDGEPTLNKRPSYDYPLPALDGATALFPVYSAFAQALYPDGTSYDNQKNDAGNPLIICTKTNEAYRRLVDGQADIIFVAQPSDAQINAAKAAGVEFEMVPFGKEAFVFIVNKDNPLDNITIDQIQQVYSGKITEWGALGVEGLGDIVAYQRPKDSGSQTALEKLMGDIPLMTPPQKLVMDFMAEILETIEYRNLPNALGYTFRFFCTEMVGSDVKLLSINGIAPTPENIRNDSYPITSTLYAITRKGDPNPNTRAVLEWIQSPQGMELIEKSGYIPWIE